MQCTRVMRTRKNNIFKYRNRYCSPEEENTAHAVDSAAREGENTIRFSFDDTRGRYESLGFTACSGGVGSDPKRIT